MAGPRTVVGIDIGRYAVKVVWAARRRGTVFTRAEVLRVPQDVSDRKTVIGPWLGKLGLGRAPCVLGFPGFQTMFQPFVLGVEDPRTPQQAAAMEVVRFNEMASENMIFDLCPFALRPGERRVFLAMARPSLVQPVLQAARDMDLNVIGLAPTPVALYHALRPAARAADRPWMAIGVGYGVTEMAVGSAGGLLFARAVSAGGQMFSDAIAKERGVSASQAEHLKLSGGLRGGDEAVADVLGRVAEVWLTELQSSLAVYRSLYAEEEFQPDRIVLVGGASQLGGLAGFVAERLGLPVAGAPDLGAALAENGASCVTAAGLAATGLGEGAAINLLPPRLKDELIFRRQKPYWIAAGLVAALALGVSLLGGYRDFRKNERELSRQNTSLVRRQQIADEIEAIEAKNSLLYEMGDNLGRLAGGASLMRELATLVAESKSAGDWISVICDADSYFARNDPLAPAPVKRELAALLQRNTRQTERPPPPPALERAIIEGYTRTPNLSTVKVLIARLEEADFVVSADLLSDDRVVEDGRFTETWPNPYAKRFVIDVRIIRPPAGAAARGP